MTDPTPTIRVKVDPCNPGQFFACCGLLELADRLWHGAEGWFEEREFQIACEGTLRKLLEQLCAAKITSSLSEQQIKRLDTLQSLKKSKLTQVDVADKFELSELWKHERLYISSPFDLCIDWWRDNEGKPTAMKTWAAKQRVLTIARAMQSPLQTVGWSDLTGDVCLTRAVTVEALPFYFDSGLSGQGSALDAGFSFDALGFKMPFRPLLELAAFVGLQRFRPAQVPGRKRFRFCLWSTPLLPPVAAAVASGAVDSNGARQYEFRLLKRSDYMKAFLPAQPYRGDNQ